MRRRTFPVASLLGVDGVVAADVVGRRAVRAPLSRHGAGTRKERIRRRSSAGLEFEPQISMLEGDPERMRSSCRSRRRASALRAPRRLLETPGRAWRATYVLYYFSIIFIVFQMTIQKNMSLVNHHFL